jgi:hypothetical protein
MDVLVRMLLGEMQPNAGGHERAGDDELQRHGLAEK